ncbi:WXG100 family type VII secretion target [Microbacterium sp. ARD32]|uniref:WXG100 family type VII secretion target n=1 Tax=Microbacterium sp. ARD32 TaxID=2962577 RepID=UPI002881527A|nr:WXG100 family type VII secretion target [Microbacterium sp. ARD32]MDT0156139.1 WXG100 family type VII secretion target [Microbacterium sp. ARD32]
MGGNGYKMQFGAVDAAGTDLVGSASTIETKLNDMETALRPLQADWTGSASEAYVQAKAKWNAALTEMKALLHDIGRQVSQDSADAQANENRNKNRW